MVRAFKVHASLALALVACIAVACGGGGGGGGKHAIAGHIASSSGGAAAGVTVTLTGAAIRSATTDAGGDYSFDGLSDGKYQLTPSKTGHVFSPPSLSATVSGADVGSLDFTRGKQRVGLPGLGPRQLELINGEDTMRTTLASLCAILSLAAGPAAAQSIVPNVFTSGTPAKASEVNANFAALADHLPAVKLTRLAPAMLPTSITSSDTPQDMHSITVTPPADGYVLLIATTLLLVREESGGVTNVAYFSLTNASETQSANVIAPFVTVPANFTFATYVVLPVSLQAVYPVSAGVASTFYLTARRDSTGKNQLGINNSANDTSLTAIFFPAALP